MALESATFFIEDYKGRHYKVHAVRDSGFGLDETLWCMVYRCVGTDDSPEWNRIYEEDYSADFSLGIEDCLDLNDEIEVETVIHQKFNDGCWVANWIDLPDEDIEVPNENANDAEVKADILQCKVKSVLDKYHNLDLDRLPIANALYSLSKIAEEMAEILEEKFA